jgi:3',5'-cyclic AMP phosphodiesterase CpdA
MSVKFQNPILVVGLLLLVSGCARPEAEAIGAPRAAVEESSSPFLVKPYLQWGDSPIANRTGSIQVVWQDTDVESAWTLEYRPGVERPWQQADPPAMRRIDVPTITPHRLYRAPLRGLEPGGKFSYRVRKGGEIVFAADGVAPKTGDAPFRFVVFGDCGVNTLEQKGVAYQAYRSRPDFVLITGDIVYDRGRVSEYREKFWPIYNADEAGPSAGAPLLRSTLFLAVPGNHDIGVRDLGKFADGLAYFLYWSQPLNGPQSAEGSASAPPLLGPEINQKAFKEAAGAAYPRMANFSFDYGNAHWTVLDANPYVDWTDRDLRAWVEADLAAARGATWRFVAFHQPGFNSARKHFDEQGMRLLSDVFEAGKVDVAFSGHVHNYQRTYPLRFVPEKRTGNKAVRMNEPVPGRWTLDRTYDGVASTRPDGLIYLISGAGGASLYNPEQQDDPSTWQEFTHKFIAKIHSYTLAEVEGTRLTIRQVSFQGAELDRFVITK